MRSSLFWDVTQRKLVFTNVSEQPMDPILKDQAAKDDGSTLQDGTDRLSRNVGNYQHVLRNIAEERRAHLQRGGWLKSFVFSYNACYISCPSHPPFESGLGCRLT